MKTWLVYLTRFESGVHHALLVKARTKQAAQNKALRFFGEKAGETPVNAILVASAAEALDACEGDIYELFEL